MNLPKNFFRNRMFSFALALMASSMVAPFVTLAGVLSWFGITMYIIAVLVLTVMLFAPNDWFSEVDTSDINLDQITKRNPLIWIVDWGVLAVIVYFLYIAGWEVTAITYGTLSVTTTFFALAVQEKMVRLFKE